MSREYDVRFVLQTAGDGEYPEPDDFEHLIEGSLPNEFWFHTERGWRILGVEFSKDERERG